MNNKTDPVDSRSLSLFKEWVYQRSEAYDAPKIANDPTWNLDRAAVSETCMDLSASELAPALLYAIYLGDVTLAECLWSERGPFKVQLVHAGPNQFELNKEAYTLPFDRMYLFEAVRTIDQLKTMFDLIDHPDITGLLDGAGALFLIGQQSAVAELARKVEFEGILPTLGGEMVSDPELMVALNERSRGRQHPAAYDPILCWATPEMVETYGAFLDPYLPVHGVKLADEFVSFADWQALHTQAEIDGVQPPECKGLTLRFQATKNDELGQIVMQAFGSKKQKHGIFEKPGHVLCHTSCRFLAEFERPGAMDSQNYAAARSFTHGYVPFDLLMLNAHPSGNLNWPTENGFHQVHGDKELYFMRLDPEIHQALGPVLNHNQWKSILRGNCLKGRDIVTAVKVFGLDNQGMIWRLEQETPGDLKALGYRFTPDTEVLFQDKKGDTIWNRQNTGATCVCISEIKTYCKRTSLNDFGLSWGKSMLEAVYEVGLWPFKDAKRSVSELIPRLARKKNPSTDLSDMASIARIIIKDSPIEECVKHARTASEWTVLANIHGPEAMQPYLRVMPLTSRGRVFSQDLGL